MVRAGELAKVTDYNSRPKVLLPVDNFFSAFSPFFKLP